MILWCPSVPWGSYFDYICEWSKHVDDENVMTITYEELKEVRLLKKWSGNNYTDCLLTPSVLLKYLTAFGMWRHFQKMF